MYRANLTTYAAFPEKLYRLSKRVASKATVDDEDDYDEDSDEEVEVSLLAWGFFHKMRRFPHGTLSSRRELTEAYNRSGA